jgi:hypothetical protein
MFFIGGFNSVIPYVVYLSLIWTFVILSFGGRIAAILHRQQDREIASASMSYKAGDDHFLRCFHYDQVRQSQHNTAFTTPDLSQLRIDTSPSLRIGSRYFSPPLPPAKLFSFLYRGPPLFC